ncbi:MAG: hypothetical protein ACO3EY_07130 [Candidatus Nanopelagicales bacterium]
MENASLVTTEQPKELTVKEQDSKQQISNTKKKTIPSSYQDVLTKIQQQALDRNELLVQVEQDIAAVENAEKFTTLLQTDKEKAKRIIDSLVSSAKQMTSAVTSSITSTPVHPYEKLIHDYLGPNYKPNTIEDYSIPDNFSFLDSLKQLRKAAEANQELQTTQMAILTAEAANSLFNGTFDTENLNNAFAEPVKTADGKQTFVINETKLKEHLEFMEMVKNIPKEYILKNPLEVAKKIISEFIRIHEPKHDVQITDDGSVPSFTIKEIVDDPFETTKRLFSNFQQLNGADNTFDIAGFLKNLNCVQKVEQLTKS